MTLTTPFLPQVLSKKTARLRMNELGKQGEVFFFLFDFELKKPIVLTKKELKDKGIYFDINGKNNFKYPERISKTQDIVLQKKALDKAVYEKAFKTVQQEINAGNSYLLAKSKS